MSISKRTKEIIIAIQDHDPVYANATIGGFVEGMKAIEPTFLSKDTLNRRFEDSSFTYFVNPTGKVYEIYRYQNPNYEKR